MDLVGHQVGQRDSTRNQHNQAIACLTSVSKKQTELRFLLDLWPSISSYLSNSPYQRIRRGGGSGRNCCCLSAAHTLQLAVRVQMVQSPNSVWRCFIKWLNTQNFKQWLEVIWLSIMPRRQDSMSVRPRFQMSEWKKCTCPVPGPTGTSRPTELSGSTGNYPRKVNGCMVEHVELWGLSVKTSNFYGSICQLAQNAPHQSNFYARTVDERVS